MTSAQEDEANGVVVFRGIATEQLADLAARAGLDIGETVRRACLLFDLYVSIPSDRVLAVYSPLAGEVEIVTFQPQPGPDDVEIRDAP